MNCGLGAPFGSVAYNVKRLAERYPGLEIDWRKNVQAMHDGYFLAGKSALWSCRGFPDVREERTTR